MEIKNQDEVGKRGKRLFEKSGQPEDGKEWPVQVRSY